MSTSTFSRSNPHAAVNPRHAIGVTRTYGNHDTPRARDGSRHATLVGCITPGRPPRAQRGRLCTQGATAGRACKGADGRQTYAVPLRIQRRRAARPGGTL